MKATVLGGSGFAGGELLRLLEGHPEVTATTVTSERSAGTKVRFLHPNLRGTRVGELEFRRAQELPDETCDVLFLALPHGHAMTRIEELAERAPRVVDLSADFRLGDASAWRQWYGEDHAATEWLDRFVYGLPELNRERLRALADEGTGHASGVGCNATALHMALLPFLEGAGRELVDWSRGVVAEVKVGSSEAGARASAGSHHPVRSGSVRSFSPTGHRHAAEVERSFRSHGIDTQLHLSATAIEMVRGVLATVHLFATPEAMDSQGLERALFRAYRQRVKGEPFVRLVKEKRGLYRYPEPKILAGTNHAEIGFDVDTATGRVVALAAIDNLGKGAAGTAVQTMNCLLGLDETTGLTFPGLHPI